jgi:hypothetical protein
VGAGRESAPFGAREDIMESKRDNVTTEHSGLARATGEAVVHQVQTLTSLATAAGSSALGALPEPFGALVDRSRAALEELLDVVPPIADEIDVLAEELHAKRASIQALQAELGALDLQLAVVERSLAPVQVWSHRWHRLQGSIVEALVKTR